MIHPVVNRKVVGWKKIVKILTSVGNFKVTYHTENGMFFTFEFLISTDRHVLQI